VRTLRFSPGLPLARRFELGDGIILLLLAGLLYAGMRLSFHAPAVVAGPEISLSVRALPWYALLSTGRMVVAYLLSLLFTLVYGYAAARSRTAEVVLMPVLDVLQSVPILSFLPVVLLSFSVLLPESVADEVSAIVLIFTSQAWNMTYSYYQSLKTIPEELKEAAAVFRLNPWLRFKTVELPFGALGLIWNSMMSWAGGWFFLMAAEIFTVGTRQFRLPGIGAYLQVAASAGDLHAVTAGVLALVLTIVLLDQLIWRPILAWADKFKIEMVAGDRLPESWFLEILSRSWLATHFRSRLLEPLAERIDRAAGRLFRSERAVYFQTPEAKAHVALRVVGLFAVAAGLYGAYRTVLTLRELQAGEWRNIGIGVAATSARVAASVMLALLWTVPAGVAIGTNRRLARIFQPLVEVVASVPATALFPVLLLAVVALPHGMDLAAVVLMLMACQWYLLFNVIAGAAAIPQDLRYTTDLLGLSRLDRWRTLILPALFPYIVTGAITASGGAWNASIIAERAEFGGLARSTTGVGALIARASSAGNYPLLLAGTLALIVTVITVNRLFWRRLYRVAEERYRME
jgi:NitT/TauT family transport system permease protein